MRSVASRHYAAEENCRGLQLPYGIGQLWQNQSRCIRSLN